MITTIKGDISAQDLQYILPHEHLLSDLGRRVFPKDHIRDSKDRVGKAINKIRKQIVLHQFLAEYA